MDDRVIARTRLRTQNLTGQRAAGAVEAVCGLLAVQAENHSQASWAVATRARGVGAADLAALFDAGAILRTHVLRPTWHYVCPDDIGWLLELTRPRVRPVMDRQLAQGGFDHAAVARAGQVMVDAIAAEGALTREQVGERLNDAGHPMTGQQLMLLAACVEFDGLICSGPMAAGGQHTYALLADRAPGARHLDRDEALAELALRYVSGHGPATARDLAYWATLTLTDARAGLAAVADRLDTFDHGGRTYWCTAASTEYLTGSSGARDEPNGHLLQILDETYRGYQDSRWVLDAARLVPRTRESAAGMALVDAQIVATMRRTVHSDRVDFELGPYRDLDGVDLDDLRAAAERYGRFLGLEASLH